MRILFMGTPSFAANNLTELLAKQHEIIGVVTQPDRPQGRGMKSTPSETKIVALKAGLPLYQPEQINSPEFLEIYRELAPDMVVVVAFGQKIPAEILFGSKYGCINVHGSVLPKYRGAAPVQWSILNGDSTAGVTTMYMDEGWDTGDIIYQAETPVGTNENFGELYERLSILGAELLSKTIDDLQAGKAPRIKQDESLVVKAPKLKKEWQKLDWNMNSQVICNRVRVFAPLPGAETNFGEERLKIMEVSPADYSGNGNPGEILEIVKKQGILVATADGALMITKVQPNGKKVMSALDYANGRRLQPGMVFKTLF